MSPPPEVSLSVVSHGQGQLIAQLLDDIQHGVDVPFELFVTLNIHENESFLAPFADLRPTIIRNAWPKGFGANHNAAFARSSGRYFAVLNPDIRARPLRLRPLIETLERTSAGACGPRVCGPDGRVQDSVRRFPTVGRLLMRKLGRQTGPDYPISHQPLVVDWVAGMFAVYPRQAYEQAGGFDEGYFMYVEDADLCWRLARLGWPTVQQPDVVVVHDARRASRKSLQHFHWHARSALRFLLKRTLQCGKPTTAPSRHNPDVP